MQGRRKAGTVVWVTHHLCPLCDCRCMAGSRIQSCVCKSILVLLAIPKCVMMMIIWMMKLPPPPPPTTMRGQRTCLWPNLHVHPCICGRVAGAAISDVRKHAHYKVTKNSGLYYEKKHYVVRGSGICYSYKKLKCKK